MTTTLRGGSHRNVRGRRFPAAADPETGRGRTVVPHVSLPTGRAIVGGLLVAVSALGIFAAHRAATVTETTEWLIVRGSVAAGSVITADDLALAPMTLADVTRRRAVTRPGEVIGHVALVPLADGDLVLRSDIADSADAGRTSGRRVGIALDAADALGGDVSVGDRVDVVAVPSADETSRVIVRGALVSALGDRSGDSVGSEDHLQINLEVPDETAAQLIIDARAKDGITLIAASTVTLDAPAAATADVGPATR